MEEANSDLNSLEIYYINLYDSVHNGYNISSGGESFRNIMLDKETKASMIKNLKKYYETHPSPFKGKHHTIETRNILREKSIGRPSAFKGKTHTIQTKEKLSMLAKQRIGDKNPFYGKQCSQSTKDALSKANGKEVVQIDKNTNEILNIFASAQIAALYLGKKKNACKETPRKGHRKTYTAYGYKWKLKKDIEGSTTIGTDGKKYYIPSTSTLQANGSGSGEHSIIE